MTDSDKLTAFAKEVITMRKAQANYFRLSNAYRKGRAAQDEVSRALIIARDHENRVDTLALKCLNRQTEMFFFNSLFF